jgi:hypothetical protein
MPNLRSLFRTQASAILKKADSTCRFGRSNLLRIGRSSYSAFDNSGEDGKTTTLDQYSANIRIILSNCSKSTGFTM